MKTFGSIYNKKNPHGAGYYANMDWILDLLDNPRWAWFNRVRGEVWFKEALEWVESLPRPADD